MNDTDTRLHLKICCIADVGEARLAIDVAGADALGLVSAMPSGPGVIDEATIREVVLAVAAPVQTFLLTSLTEADAIAAQHARCGGPTTLQLVDRLPVDQLVELRARLPAVHLVQVIHVLDATAIDEAHAAEPFVDALLLDSGNPHLEVKQLGGTGRVHDWSISAALRDAVALPVWLAGGLNADNVAEAVRIVRPHGVDLCSGVRRDGRLDAARLAAFVAACGGADPA